MKLHGTIENILTADELEAVTSKNTKDEPVVIDFQVINRTIHSLFSLL